MEATSTYGDALARFLFEIGYQVSIVNPSRPKAFGRSQLSRTKTDRTDAKTIARFCLALTPALWTPPPIEVEQLQALVHRLDNLKGMQQQERNRLETADMIVVWQATIVQNWQSQLAEGVVHACAGGASIQPVDSDFL